MPKAAVANTEAIPNLAITDFKALREKLGLSQKVFWERVFITQSGGSRYEKSGRVPTHTAIVLNMVYGTETNSARIFKKLRKAA